MADGTMMEVVQRVGQTAWDVAAALLDGSSAADVSVSRAVLARRLDLASRAVVASVAVELGDGSEAWAELREGQTAWEAAGAFLDGLGKVFDAPQRAAVAERLDAVDPRPSIASVEVELEDGTSAWAELRGGQLPWDVAGSFIEEQRPILGLFPGVCRLALADRLHGSLPRSYSGRYGTDFFTKVDRGRVARARVIVPGLPAYNRKIIESREQRPMISRVEAPLPDGRLGWAEMHEGQTAWEAAGTLFESLGWFAGDLDDLWEDRATLADKLDPSWRPVVARTEVQLADGATETVEMLWGQTAWEATEAFLRTFGRGAAVAELDPSAVADLLDADDVRPVVARVETEMADGTMGWVEMRGGQSAWVVAEAFLDRSGWDRGADRGLRRASLAKSLTEAWTASATAGDGVYGSVSGAVHIAGESFAYAGALPEGAPWVACVLTTPDAADRRRWVRETLGRHVPVVFLVGRGGEEEGDTLVFDVEERYSNPRSSPSVKVIGCMEAVLRHRPETQFVLKVDHDTALDFAELRREAEALLSPIYLGKMFVDALPFRQSGHKHFLSYDDFALDVLPPYALGAAFAVDVEAARRLMDEALGERVFLQEDYWIGVLAEKAGIRPTHGWFWMWGDQPPPLLAHLP